ncbi:MAG: DUF1588 domain-containing protein [Akkermansiaceae bacterium]|nr:DUF1588 domain-containing protein [Akkermansiaceae bacterium]MDG1364383.1 DUF1588 domain-containing protein [Akkermansiaceae bacterium]
MVILPSEIVGFLKRVTSSRCVLGTVVASVLSAEVSEAEELLENYCYSCHDEWEQKGGLQLDELGQMPLESRLDVLNRVQEQLYLGQMPPKKKKKQPTEAERSKMLSWVAAELKKHNASTLEGKLRYPNYGNHVSHEKLFNGEIVAKPYTQARRWLVSPQIFIERINAVFGLEGGARQRSFYGVTIPVILPDHSGVRYYDTTTLDGGHLLMMLTNADWISGKQLREARIKNGEVKSNEFPNPKDRWSPRKTPEAFEFIVTKKSPPTEAEMKDAIHIQYQCVLQRDANKSELERHLKLLKESILLAGNTEGLRQMLVSVLLKSEFMYRYEFGAGEVDGAGRMKLSPREASYAIAYALSDRNPDADLLKAVEEGRLNTKEDYRREVNRMLKDESSFAGPGAPEVSGKGLNSHKVSHPKINRFFREFFGYPNMTKVFKDTKRSGGFYSNAGRGTAGTSGHVIDEADKIVDHILRKDQNVFEQLLTTDEYFVYHTRPNEQTAAIIDRWREAYDVLKSEPWQEEPEQVSLKHELLLKQNLGLKVPQQKKGKGRHDNTLVRLMGYFESTFGRGSTPYTNPPWAHGFRHQYSEIYNLAPIPGSRGGDTGQKGWDFQVEQPFKIQNRKGILTHPAWLLAHSQNTETDPVRRGKWIREKLLAGYVPDVPITVDAQIPEDHHRTLRERLDEVTSPQECWKCHVHMNPLGLTFEMFDDFGRFRTAEVLEHPENLVKAGNGKTSASVYKTKPLSISGVLEGTGDSTLDGKVKDAYDLIDRLAKSRRVRQSIIRHAFRYFMGRNELLSDSQTLIDAEIAYANNSGSFKSVIISLLTSDSFIYRKETQSSQ